MGAWFPATDGFGPGVGVTGAPGDSGAEAAVPGGSNFANAFPSAFTP